MGDNTMKEQIVSFKTAKLAKEKGFNIPVHGMYINYDENHTKDIIPQNYPEPDQSVYNWNSRKGYSAPTQSLLQKWLREKHNMSVEIGCTISKFWIWHIYEISSGELLLGFVNHSKIYEEALEQGLIEALKLIK